MITYPLEAGGLTTRVHEAGSGGRNVLFLHGLGARADRWCESVERFAERGYRCVAFDFPGHGFASKGTGPDYSVPGFATVALDVMDRLSLENAVLVGTSLGAHVAGHMTLREPSRVRGLVIIGAVGLAPVEKQTRQAISDSIVKTARADIERKLKFVIADKTLVTDRWVEEEWRINNSPGAAASFQALGEYFLEHLPEHEIGAPLAELVKKLPVCLIWGAEDRAVPVQVGEQVAAILGGLPLKLIPGAGHAPYFEQPAAFDEIALPFLQSLSWS